MIEMQKAFGRVMNPKLVMQGWEAILSPKYSADQICYALIKYALERGVDFPSPKNINEILDPPKPRITDVEFVAAQKWQERNNNYSPYTDAHDVVQGYKAQEKEGREDWKCENEKLMQIAGSAVKMIPTIERDQERQRIEDSKL